jgi:hypothetical protein
MKKVTFDPIGVTATLINRVHRTGITMMSAIDKAQNKSESIAPEIIEDMETDYLLANLELENVLKSQLAQNDGESWKLFVDSVTQLDDAQKPLFRGVVRSVKQTAQNILSKTENPFDTQDFDLPVYMSPCCPTAPVNMDPAFWTNIFSQSESLEATDKLRRG